LAAEVGPALWHVETSEHPPDHEVVTRQQDAVEERRLASLASSVEDASSVADEARRRQPGLVTE
jgi:hypothetical protein